MRVDVYVTLSHYLDHLWPIWDALPSEVRGEFWANGAAYVAAQGKVGSLHLRRGRPRRPDILTLVASAADMLAVRDRPLILLNHGAGQTYDGVPSVARHPGYSGGRDREAVVLFLCPSESDADVNRRAYPDARAVAVGVPKLDRWHAPLARVMTDRPTVAFGWHWPCRLCPESTWAWPEYRQAVEALAASDPPYTLLGHGHPRIWQRLRGWYERMGVEGTPDFADVLARADLYVCDNSSTLPEFASTGRPVVMLNASYYRRDVDHGGRFWDWAPMGVQVDRPADLSDAIALALSDPPEIRRSRESVVSRVYTSTDGQASVRAVRAVLDVASHLQKDTHGRQVLEPR